MRFALLAVLLVVQGCSKSSSSSTSASAPVAPTLEQYREMALSVPTDDVELSKVSRAAKEAPQLADRWVVLGQNWIRHAHASNDPGQYLSAEGAAEVALSLRPGYSPALALKSLVALNQHRFNEAKDIAVKALAKDAEDLLALAALADATLELGDVEASTKAVQQMLDLKPNLQSYGRAAHLRWLKGDVAGAQSLYRRALDASRNAKDPEPQAWMAVQLALILLEQGDLDGAKAGFDFALQRVPHYAPAQVGNARVELAWDDSESAIRLLEAATTQSSLVDSLALLADAKEQRHDVAGAKKVCQSLERIGKGSDRFALARAWSEAGVHLKEAIDLLEAEQKLRPNVNVEAALAFAYFRAGQPEALPLIERVVRTGNPEVRIAFQHAAIISAKNPAQALRELDALRNRFAALSPQLKREATALHARLQAQVASK